MSSARKSVVIYHDHLIPRSERFILDQGESLTRYLAQYAGVRAVPDIVPPPERTFLLCDGSPFDRVREFRFKVTRRINGPLSRLSNLRPHLVHAHFGTDGVRAVPIAKWLGVPLVVSFHGFDATMEDAALRASSAYAVRRFPRDRPALIANTDVFLAVSQFVRSKLLARGFPEDRIRVHYIGIDTGVFRPNQVPREAIVLFVGRVVEQKGIKDFVRAVSELQKSGRIFRAVVVGDGPARADAQRFAAVTGATITFVGAQPADEVRAWMQRSAVFCVPSRRMANGAEEGFGLVFAEAQASGLPVVSYSNGGIVEAVADGETGLLAPDRDWRGIAARLARFLDNPELRATFGTAARARVARKFDLATQTRALEDIYDSAANFSGGSCNAAFRARGRASP